MYCQVKCVVDFVVIVFFQAEDGIRDLVRSRGLGDVYKRQLSSALELNICGGKKDGTRSILIFWLTASHDILRLSLIHI